MSSTFNSSIIAVSSPELDLLRSSLSLISGDGDFRGPPTANCASTIIPRLDAALCTDSGDSCAQVCSATWSGKLRRRSRKEELGPRKKKRAVSCATAAASGVAYEPSHRRSPVPGTRISDTHLPHFRRRTPLYLFSSLWSPAAALLIGINFPPASLKKKGPGVECFIHRKGRVDLGAMSTPVLVDIFLTNGRSTRICRCFCKIRLLGPLTGKTKSIFSMSNLVSQM